MCYTKGVDKSTRTKQHWLSPVRHWRRKKVIRPTNRYVVCSVAVKTSPTKPTTAAPIAEVDVALGKWTQQHCGRNRARRRIRRRIRRLRCRWHNGRKSCGSQCRSGTQEDRWRYSGLTARLCRWYRTHRRQSCWHCGWSDRAM